MCNLGNDNTVLDTCLTSGVNYHIHQDYKFKCKRNEYKYMNYKIIHQ